MAVPEDLIARMTLEEKIGQLTMLSAGLTVTGPVVETDLAAALRAGRLGSVFNLHGRAAVRAAQRAAVEDTRLGVPLFFAFDVIHGFRTVFPIPLAEAGSFDPALWARTARIAAVEAAAEGVDLTFAPMLDVARDPRWGRIAESPGEDPLVAVRYAVAKVRGYRAGPPQAALAVTAKHFVGYGASLGGRDYGPVEISRRGLEEVHLPPFAAAVRAGAEAVMPAFTDIDGVPLTAHRGLLTDVLRADWGFAGLVISDYSAIAELVDHGVAADLAEAAALALRAGVDIDMTGAAYPAGLPEALARGLVGPAEIDAAVARVLAFKDRLGLFDDPYVRCGPQTPPDRTPAHRAMARQAAARSLVLLANNGILPFAAAPERLALIGPLVDAPAEMLGSWSGAGRIAETVAVLGGLRAAWPQAAIEIAQGTGFDDQRTEDIPAAVAAARRADCVILCLGEAVWMSGEAASRARLDLPGRQADLAAAVIATGTPVVVLLFAGRPLVLPASLDKAAALVACWQPGSEAGHGIADVLTGRTGPSARLAATWPRHVGQIPIHAASRRGGRPEDPADRYTTKYIDLESTPRFPFGAGLSYGAPAIERVEARLDRGLLRVEATLRNRGARAAEVPVFLFVGDPVARVARPERELRAFTRIGLAAGTTGRVDFALPLDALAYLDTDFAPALEPGDLIVEVGLSADPAQLVRRRLRLG